MTGDGGLVEVQATAERTPLSRASLDELLALAEPAIAPARRGAGGGGRRHRGLMPRAASRGRHPQRAQAARAARDPRLARAGAAAGRGRAAARGRRDVRRERADQGARRARGDRAGGDRRRLGDRGARRSAGGPGVRSARYAGEEATDEENLDMLLRELDGAGRPRGRLRLRARPASTRTAPSASSRAAARASWRASRAARAASATTPPSSPTTPGPATTRTMAELSAGGEARDQPPRPRRRARSPRTSARHGPTR